MRNIAIIYKRGRPDAATLARELKLWLENRDIAVFCRQNLDDAAISCSYEKLEIPGDVEAVIVLGGDGTFLSVARFLEDLSTPIIGVNLGELGFLTEITRENCFHEVGEILDGRYDLEERMRLHVSLWRDGRELFRYGVLNDCVINKGALARIVDLKVSIDGRFLTHYRADGLIVATPTGSTAYNLSAGGPIIYPTAHTIILTPICPFTLSNRSIVIPSSAQVQVELGPRARDVALTCDGQVGCELQPTDQLLIIAAPTPLKLIKPATTDYFEILRTKLKWGHSDLLCSQSP